MSCLRKSPCPHHGASGRDSTRNIACNTEGVSSLYLTLRERLLNGTIWSEYLTFLSRSMTCCRAKSSRKAAKDAKHHHLGALGVLA